MRSSARSARISFPGQRLFGPSRTLGQDHARVAQEFEREALCRADCFLRVTWVGALVVGGDDVVDGALPCCVEIEIPEFRGDGSLRVDPPQNRQVRCDQAVSVGCRLELYVSPVPIAVLGAGHRPCPRGEEDPRPPARRSRRRLAYNGADPPRQLQDPLKFAFLERAQRKRAELLAEEGTGKVPYRSPSHCRQLLAGSMSSTRSVEVTSR